MIPSALARLLDPRVPSNRMAMLGFVAGALLGRRSGRPLDSGLGVLGAWALARELAPDDEGAATVAMLLAAPPVLHVPPVAAPVGATLMAVRTTVGSTGQPLRAWDALALAGMAHQSARKGEPPVAASVLAAVALSMTARDHLSPAPWVPAVIGAGALLGMLGATGRAGQIQAGRSRPSGAGLRLALLAATLGALHVPEVQTREDRGPNRIQTRRVRLARALAVILLAAHPTGNARPLWAAWLSVWLRGQFAR